MPANDRRTLERVAAELVRLQTASAGEHAKLIAALDALRTFTFPADPDAFEGTDGECTEALIPDEEVQRARRVYAQVAEGAFKAVEGDPIVEEARAALRMIRETIEEFGPVGVLPSEEAVNQFRGIGFIEEAEALVEGIRKLAARRSP